MSKFIEIHSLTYETIDKIIKRFEDYKKEYGGDSLFIQDIGEEDAGYGETYSAVYQGFRIKEENEF